MCARQAESFRGAAGQYRLLSTRLEERVREHRMLMLQDKWKDKAIRKEEVRIFSAVSVFFSVLVAEIDLKGSLDGMISVTMDLITCRDVTVLRGAVYDHSQGAGRDEVLPSGRGRSNVEKKQGFLATRSGPAPGRP